MTTPTPMHLSRDAAIVVRERATLLVHASTIRQAADRLPARAAQNDVRPVFQTRTGLTLQSTAGADAFELKVHVVDGGDLADVVSLSIHEDQGADGISHVSLEIPVERGTFGDGMDPTSTPGILAERMRRFADGLETTRLTPPGVHPKALAAALAWSATRPEEPAWVMIVPACEFLPRTRGWDFNMRSFTPAPEDDPPPRIEISEISTSTRTIDGRVESILVVRAKPEEQLVHLSRLSAVERLRVLSGLDDACDTPLPPSDVDNAAPLPHCPSRHMDERA